MAETVVPTIGETLFQVVRSDTECEGSSETEAQKGNMLQKAQKKTADDPGPSSVNKDPNGDKNEVTRKVQNTSLTCTGTVMRCSHI